MNTRWSSRTPPAAWAVSTVKTYHYLVSPTNKLLHPRHRPLIPCWRLAWPRVLHLAWVILHILFWTRRCDLIEVSLPWMYRLIVMSPFGPYQLAKYGIWSHWIGSCCWIWVRSGHFLIGHYWWICSCGIHCRRWLLGCCGPQDWMIRHGLFHCASQCEPMLGLRLFQMTTGWVGYQAGQLAWARIYHSS